MSPQDPISGLNTGTLYGGEGGIRTLGALEGTHAFQACAFDRSATSPFEYKNFKGQTLP